MSDVKKLQDYPDISFIEATSFESLKDQMVQDYQKRYKELTGEDVILAPADPVFLCRCNLPGLTV